MYPCTYDKNLEMIQPLVQDFLVFCFGFGPLVAKVRISLDQNLVCELLLPSGTYVQCFGSIALSWFSKMAARQPYLNSDRAEVW
jgi:hypothetical protein